MLPNKPIDNFTQADALPLGCLFKNQQHLRIYVKRRSHTINNDASNINHHSSNPELKVALAKASSLSPWF